MADDIKLSKVEIEELRSLIRLLKEEMSEVEFQNLLKSGPASKKMLKDLRTEASEFTSDISGVVESFGRLINEVKGTKSGVNQVVSAMKGIYKVGEEIQYAQRDITSLNEKDLAKLQEKMAMKKVDLENADKILKAEQKDLENAGNRNKIEQENIKNRLELIKNIEKEFGLSKQLKKEKKELEKQDEKAKKHSKEIEKSLEKVISDQKDIEGILNQQDGHYNTLTATLAKLKRQLEDQNKLLGLGGAAVGSLDAALGQLGLGRLAGALGISDAKTEMDSFAKKIVQDREEQLILEREISDEIEARAKGEGKLSPEVLAEKEKQLNNLKAQNAQYTGINGQFAVLKKGVSSMGSSLMKNLTDPLALSVFFVTQLFDALRKADKATGELARQFGTSYDAASNIRQELNDIANSTGNVNITTEKLQKSLMAVNAAFGANAKLSKEELVTFTRLTEEAGYTADELMGIYKISKVTGKSLDDNTKEILGTAAAFNGINKLAINEKEVLKEVNKTSNAIKLSLGGSTAELTKAVMQAKQFGINLEQADKIAEGLLNFESSISSELEAELLTGKSLNFEKARLLALNNDVAGAAAEVLKQVKSSAEFTNMNRLQQEAIAKSVGMTREELAGSLIEREALAKLDVEGAKTAQEAYETLKKQGLSEQEIAKKLGNTKFQEQLRSQSVQEKFNATVEKLKEIFISIADPIMEIVNALTPAFTVLGSIASVVGKVLKLLTTIGDGIIPKLVGGFILLGIVTGGIGKNLLSGLVAPLKLAGQGIAALLPKMGALGKLKGFLGGGSKIAPPTPTAPTPPVGGGGTGGGASRLGGFMKGINPAGMLKGAAAILVLSGALYVAAKAFQEFGDVTWEGVAKGTVALGGLTIAAVVLGKIKGPVLEGALAIAVLGASLIPFAYALKLMAPALDKFTPIIEAFGNVISKVFSGIAGVITSAFTGLSNLFKTLGEVDPVKLFAIGPALISIGAGLAVLGGGGLLSGLSKLLGGDPFKTINELASIDSSKILTLADAINKLSDAFARFSTTTASVGDVTPIIATADKIIELNSSLNEKNIAGEIIDNLSSGISSLFSKSFSLVQSVSGISSEPVVSNETSSLGKYVNTSAQNNNTSNTNSVNSNTPLDTTVVAEILKSIDMGIKNLNTKDGSVTLTLDKEVLASKVTPGVNTFNNKTKSMVQL